MPAVATVAPNGNLTRRVRQVTPNRCASRRRTCARRRDQHHGRRGIGQQWTFGCACSNVLTSSAVCALVAFHTSLHVSSRLRWVVDHRGDGAHTRAPCTQTVDRAEAYERFVGLRMSSAKAEAHQPQQTSSLPSASHHGHRRQPVTLTGSFPPGRTPGIRLAPPTMCRAYAFPAASAQRVQQEPPASMRGRCPAEVCRGRCGA